MSSISSIAGGAGGMQVSSAGRPPGGPDPAKMFSKVDADGSGGVDETELQAMLDKVNERAAAVGLSGTSASEVFSSFDTDDEASSLDQLLSAIDSDQDGNLSAEEIASFKKIAEALSKVYESSGQEPSSLCVAA